MVIMTEQQGYIIIGILFFIAVFQVNVPRYTSIILGMASIFSFMVAIFMRGK